MKTNNCTTLCIIGIGGDGCQAIRHIQETGNHGCLVLIAIHTDVIALAASGADETVLIHKDHLPSNNNWQLTDESRDYLKTTLGEQLLNADVWFVLGGFNDPESSLLGDLICQFLLERKKHGIDSFVLAIANEPEQTGDPAQQQAFEKYYAQRLEYCDTVILNTRQQIKQYLDEKDNRNNYVDQCCAVSFRAIKSITDSIDGHNQIGLTLSGAKTRLANKGEAIFTVGVGYGENRAKQAVDRVLTNLQHEGYVLTSPDINSVLIHITWFESNLSEFNVVGNALHEQLSDSIEIKMTTTLNNTIPNNEMIVSAIVVKKTIDKMSRLSRQF